MSSEDLDTKPTIETVLERINYLGAKLETRIDGVDNRLGGLEIRLGGLENAVTGLRDEVREGFRDLERRVEVMSGDMLKLRSGPRYVHDRLDKLEKAS